jgi:GAF domain-containing protein
MDVQQCDWMAGTEDQAKYLRMGIHAVQSKPLVSRTRKLLGMISTHSRAAHQSLERELRLLDIVARRVADLIEH